VQRRRRKKAAPKNVFGSVPQSPQKSRPTKSTRASPPKGRAQIQPPSVPGAKRTPQVSPIGPPTVQEVVETVAEPIVEPVITPIVEDSVEEQKPDTEKPEEDILQEQLLGGKSRKEIGLEKKAKQESLGDSGKSLKARQIIQDSMLKASLAAKKAKNLTVKVQPTTPKETPKKPQRKFRNRNSSYQPANRARRLDRSRHMEYKYEMRGLLVNIGIEEEHRSNLLATIWARGERQTIKEAKEFINEKLSEGIIDEEQLSSLEKIVEAYTVRR